MPHRWFWTEQLDPTGGHGVPASSVTPASLLVGAGHEGPPQVQYHCRPVPPPELDELPPELPPELDEPPHRPVTTVSHPSPQVVDEAHPSAGL
jgi:hypothetical protein